MQNVNLTIDRVVLDGPLMRPDRTEHIRYLLERELHRQLLRGGPLEGLASGEIPRLDVPPVQPAQMYDDEQMARGLAQSIARGLQKEYRHDLENRDL